MKRAVLIVLIMILGFLLLSCKESEKSLGVTKDDIVNYVKIYQNNSDISISQENDYDNIEKLKDMFINLKFEKSEKISLYGIMSISFYLEGKGNPIYFIEEDGAVYIINKAITYQSTSKVDYQFIYNCYLENLN